MLSVAVALLTSPAQWRLRTAAASPPEDFDHLPVGRVTPGHGWATDTSGGSLTIEPSDTGHGRELHIHTDGNGRAFLVVPGLTPPGNSFWIRRRLRVVAFLTAPTGPSPTLSAPTRRRWRPLGGQYVPISGANFFGVGSDPGPAGDWTAWQTSVPAVARKPALRGIFPRRHRQPCHRIPGRCRTDRVHSFHKTARPKIG